MPPGISGAGLNLEVLGRGRPTRHREHAVSVSAVWLGTTNRSPRIPKYVAERDIPGVGRFSGEQLAGASETSRLISRELVPEVKLIESYVTGESLSCLFMPPSRELIHEHAKWDGLPVRRVSEMFDVVDAYAGEESSRAA